MTNENKSVEQQYAELWEASSRGEKVDPDEVRRLQDELDRKVQRRPVDGYIQRPGVG
jgi:hypothetical protein